MIVRNGEAELPKRIVERRARLRRVVRMATSVTISESVFVRAEPEVVWDFTQDFARRALCAPGVLAVQAPGERQPRGRAAGVGAWSCVLEREQSERPRHASVEMSELDGSRLVVGGGASWSYERSGRGTVWTQTITLQLRRGPIARLARPLVGWRLRRAMLRGMLSTARAIDRYGDRSSTRWHGIARYRLMRWTWVGFLFQLLSYPVTVATMDGCKPSWIGSVANLPALLFALCIPPLRIDMDNPAWGVVVLFPIFLLQWVIPGAVIDLWRWDRRLGRRSESGGAAAKSR